MSDRISKIKIGSYVRLREGFDQTDFYRGVSAGATGWVTSSKVDEYGFPMLFVEWDELNNNWAGEPDKWAFESHFQVLDDNGMNLDKNERYIAELRVATDAALASDAFVLIAVKEFDAPGGLKKFVANVFSSEIESQAQSAIDREIIIIAECIKEDEDYSDLREEDFE